MTRQEARTELRNLLGDFELDRDAMYNAILHDAYMNHMRARGWWPTVMNAADTGWNLAAGSSVIVSTNNTSHYIAEVLSLHREASNTAVDGPPLEKIDSFEEIVRMLATDTTPGTVRYYHAHRIESSLSATQTPTRWRLLVHPIPSANVWFSARVRSQGGRLDAEGQALEVPPPEAYLIVRDAAMLGGALLGLSPEHMQTIDAKIADRVALVGAPVEWAR